MCACVCVSEYYSALKKNEVLSTWMNLKDLLSKISQTQTNTARSYLYMESKNAKLIETEIRMVVIIRMITTTRMVTIQMGWEEKEMGKCWSKDSNFQL